MRNPFSNIFNSGDHFRVTHRTFDIEKLVRSTLKASTPLKGGGSRSDAKLHSSFIFEHYQLGVHASYDEIIEDKSDDLADLDRKVDDIKANWSAYVESEKKTISEKLYRLIDRLAAQVERMKSQAKEHKYYNTKNQ